jgi:hypothetical protein
MEKENPPEESFRRAAEMACFSGSLAYVFAARRTVGLLTEEGLRPCEELFRKYFGKHARNNADSAMPPAESP